MLLLALLLEATRVPGLVRVAPSFPASVFDSVLWLAALSGFAAAVAGWLLSQEGGYDERLLDRHLWSGVGTAIGAFVCVVLRPLADYPLQRSTGARDSFRKVPRTPPWSVLGFVARSPSFGWAGLWGLLERMPLPAARVVHSVYRRV